MNIYSPSKDDTFFVDLKEWCKKNPLTDRDLEENLEFKELMREEAKQKALIRNYTKIKCETCGKINNVGNHKRWHGKNCGKKQSHTEITKKKISDSLKGRIFSEEHRKNLSEGNKKRIGIKFKKKT
jgi:hypothetical protein